MTAAVTPLEARCEVCLDTGEVGQMGYLDCRACDAATKRAALEAWAQDHCLAHVGSDDLWRIHQHALAAAPVVPVAAQPVVTAMPDKQIIKHRAEGRLEALQVILGQDPESPFSKEIDGSVSPATGEYDSWWDEPKLRKLLRVDDITDSPFDRAEIAYIDALHERDEAKYARNFAENMHSSHKIRAALERAGEYDLIAELCTSAPQPAASVTDVAKDAARLDWLRDNYFSCQKDEWDERQYPNSIKWTFYGPMGIQGNVRDVIDAAIAAQQGEKT